MLRARSFASLSLTSFVLPLLAACGSSSLPASDASLQPVSHLPAAPPPGKPARAERPAAPAPAPARVEPQNPLEKDRAKMKADNEAEIARLTPAIHAEAKKLAEATYPSGKAAIQAIAKGKHRAAGHAERDKYRHPVETLDFLGLKPNMTVLEVGPGEGWYTELLAPALAKSGKLFITNGDPNGPETERPTYYAQRVKLFLDRLPEAYGKVETITVTGTPSLGHEGQLDMALVFRGLHGMVNAGTLDTWLAQLNAALKPGGVLGIEQHRAKPDAKPEESAKNGYLPEKWVIEKIEGAGFKLAGKSEVNANAKDTKDYEGGVWTLPPSLAKGDKDKDKYVAIGESDRMTLKFVKPGPSKTPPAPPTAGTVKPIPPKPENKPVPPKPPTPKAP